MNYDLSSKKIAVVDDDLPSFLLVEELLGDYGASLLHFDNGSDFLQQVKSGELPDLVIMDIQLPGENGLEITRKFKKMHPGVPVIAYTSYAMSGDRESCIGAGCDAYISKPVDIERFTEVVIGLIG